MLNSAWFEACAAACPLGPYTFPPSSTEVNKLEDSFQAHTTLATTKDTTAQEQISYSLSSREVTKLTFLLARFIKVFLISLLLAAFSFSRLVHLFSLSFTEIPSVPSTTFLPVMASSLLLFPTQPTWHAAICVSLYFFLLFFFFQDFTIFNLLSTSNPPPMKTPWPVFSTKPRLARSEAVPRSWSPEAQPKPSAHVGPRVVTQGPRLKLLSPQPAGKFKVYNACSDNCCKSHKWCFSKLLHSNC